MSNFTCVCVVNIPICSLKDKHLKCYFNKPKTKRQLRQSQQVVVSDQTKLEHLTISEHLTQITDEGKIVEEKDWRRRNLEMERREREETEDSRRRRRREEELRSNK